MSEARDIGERLVVLAEEAGKLVLEVYATDFDVQHKGPNDPVTQADKRSNDHIVEALLREHPGAGMVAEESDPSTYDHDVNTARVFFVDPLDGTREFVLKNGEFVIMIGCVEHGRVVSGVVHAPAQGKSWLGVVGEGAWELDRGARRPLRVTDRSFDDARIVVSRSRRAPKLEKLLASHRADLIEPLGSAGLKACAVAEGRADLYAQLDRAGCLWDAAGPEAVVRGAGGVLVRQDGRLIDYTQKDVALRDGLVAGNPGVVAEVVRRVALPA